MMYQGRRWNMETWIETVRGTHVKQIVHDKIETIFEKLDDNT